ncbi:MAG: hypothetical protein ACLPID_03820 [Beijerinckiaceae bacterium]
MTEQLQLRRGTATQVDAFTGAQGEVVVDTTNNRAVVNDGSTAGGWPAAKLAEVITNTRTAVSDAAYTALVTDRLIAYTAITAARTITLPAASTYPTGTALTIVDESGSCSATNTITLARAGSDTIDGATSAVVSSAYGYLAIESNGSSKWTIVDQATSNLAAVGIGTPADPNNVLSAYGVSALFNSAGNFNVTVNKGGSAGAPSDTASFIFEDGFSGRAQIGLNGSDNFSFKVSPNGSTWTTAITLDATTGAASFANMRTPVADAAYSALVTDRLIAYTALTAARIVTLPAAASYPAGTRLTIVDESGSCSASKTITLARAGSDTISGGTSAVIAAAYGYLAIESNGSNAWTIVDQATASTSPFTGDTGSGGAAGAVPAPPAGSAAESLFLGAGGSWAFPSQGGLVNKFRNGTMDIWQRGTSGLAVGASTVFAYTADGWMVAGTYSSGSGPVVSQAGGRLTTKNSLQVTGASNVTDVKIKQRIESFIAAALCSQTVTVQAQIYNNTGGAITPTLTVNRPSAQDNYGSVTADVSAANLQTCANSAWTQVAYTLNANAASYNGLEILFDFGNNFSTTGKDIQITELDIRVTPGVSTGLNSSPPVPELRPIAAELAFCQRYYLKLGGNVSEDIIVAGYNTAGNGTAINMVYPATMRANPTATQVGTWTSSNVSATNIYAGQTNASFVITASSTGSMYSGTFSTSAYLTFSAEL